MGMKSCSEDVSVSFLRKTEVKMTQCWAIGFSVLDLSKYAMGSMYYNCIKPAFKGRVSTLYSDTDSWLMLVPAPSPDVAVKKIETLMDFSNYRSTHKFHNVTRKNVPGFLKNEVPDDTITKFCGVRQKVYSIMKQSEQMESRCKGISAVFKRKIPFEDFVSCLDSISEVKVEQFNIRSVGHQIQLQRNKKTAFNSFYSTRYLLCARHSVPYGSILIDYQKLTGNCYFCKNPSVLV